MRIRTRAITMTAIILAFSMMSVPSLIGSQMGFGVAQGQPSPLYPVIITLSTGETVFIATHTSDLAEGNWIELSGGTSIKLPSPLTLAYEGLVSATYDRDEVTITIESSFATGEATYPLTTHQIYSAGQPIIATFCGASAIEWPDVDFKLFRLSSVSEIRDIAIETFQGNLAPILDKLADPLWSQSKVELNGTGDATVNIPQQEAGVYLLAVVKQNGPDIYIYSATIIEVVDHPLNVICPSSVKQGDPLYVNTELIGATTGFYIHGAAMIKETAYTGKIKLKSDGSILTTELYLNDVLVADGDLILAISDLSDLDPFSILEQLTSIYGYNQLSVGYAVSFDSVTGSMSLSTSSLNPGDYILLVGVCKDLGSRIVGLYQTTVTVTLPGLPVADAGGPYTGKPGVAITFDGSGSYDIDGYIDSYAWTFGDGETGTGVSPSHTYTADGTYIVTLTITDNASQTAFDTTYATITTPTKPPPTPPPYIPPTNQPPVAEAGPNQTIHLYEVTHLSGAESYDPDGTIIFYKWDLSDGEIAYGQNISHTYQEPGSYTVNLTITDNGNAQASDTCTITVREIPPIPIPPLPPYLDNLNITPAEIELGDNVTISFDIRNLDSQSIDYGVDIHIEKVNVTRIWVELGAYEFKTVSHTITPDTVGIYNVTVHGMTGNFTVKVPEIPLRPAEFVVSDLTITPEEVELPADIDVWTFKITVNVTNIGEQEGSHIVELKVAGLVVESGTVMLRGGERSWIVYVLKRGVGSYTVEVDGLTGSFKVKAPPKPAEFEVSNLVVTPQDVEPGANVTISTMITNIGDESGGYIIEFKLDGVIVGTKTVELNGGESETVTFTTSSETEGSHSVETEGLSGTFTVEAPPPKIPPLTWIALIIAITAILLYIIWKRTDWIEQLRSRKK